MDLQGISGWQMSIKNDKESKSLVDSVSKKMQLQIQVQKVAEKR